MLTKKMKQGGESFNGQKKGVKDRFKCSECGRIYKMEWARDTHQKQCIDYNRVNQ